MFVFLKDDATKIRDSWLKVVWLDIRRSGLDTKKTRDINFILPFESDCQKRVIWDFEDQFSDPNQ